MTDPEFADKTYIEPITEEVVLNIIKKKILMQSFLLMGGQTALNITVMQFKRALEGIKFLESSSWSYKKRWR